MEKRALVVCLLLLIAANFLFGQALIGQLPSPRVVKNRPLRVVFMAPNVLSESTLRNYRQFQIECAYRGWELIEAIPVPHEQASNMTRSLIAKNPDAIANSYTYFDSWLNEVRMAREKGIGVYAIDTEIKPGVIVCPRQFDGAAGAKVMSHIVDRIGYKGNVAIMWWHRHEGVDRRTACAETIAEWYERKGVKLVSIYDIATIDFDVEGFNAASAWANKYGKSLKAVFCGFDTPALFAANAFISKGYTRKDIILGGIDGGTQALAAIRDPRNPFKVTLSQPFELYAHMTCEVIDKVQVQGMSIEDALESVGADPEIGNIILEGRLITPENVPPKGSTYYEVHDWYGEDPNNPNSWVNWWKKTDIEPYRS
jgi:ABC-type sugar transport system substrate-binding protein